MPWVNPRWGSLTGPDAEALRAIFESISEWTRNPSFGNATNPTIAGGGMVQVQPQALTIKNEWIQSANFASGSAGWQIKANGDAEFNNIAIRGTLKTALSGRRIEIGTTAANEISLYSGVGSERALIIESNVAGVEALRMYGPFSGSTNSLISLSNSALTITGNTSINPIGAGSLASPGLAVGGGGGVAAVFSGETYVAAGANLRVDGSVILAFGGHFNATGGGSFLTTGGHFETSSGNHWTGTGRIFVRAGYVVAGSVGEGIITTGSTAGIRIGQRNRGSNDITESYAIYGNNDQLGIYNQTIGDVMTFRNVGGWHEWKSLGLPALGGTTLVITGTGQIGPTTSSSEAKRNIVLLPETENANPLWKIKPRRAQWDPSKVGNAAEENERLPNGFATTLVEDWVEQGALDAIHVNAEGVPYALDHAVIQSYIISAVQHCHEGLARRVAKEEELERRVAAIEAHPVLKGKK